MSTPSPTLPALLAVASGGATGSVVRSLLTDAGASVPATLAVNVVGCLALGVLVARVRGRGTAWLFAGPGLLGGFTTMSAWAEQSRTLTLDSSPALAALYVVLTPALCVGVALVGMRLASRRLGAGPGAAPAPETDR